MRRKDVFLLALILLFALSTRLWNIFLPVAEYFDEGYQLAAAQLMLDGQWKSLADPYDPLMIATRADWLHPPTYKYFLMIPLKFFGYQSWAWRLPSVFLSIASLLLFYFLLFFLGKNFLFLRKTGKARNFALFGTALLSLDTLFFVQSRIAMNDIALFFFSILLIFLYFAFLFFQKEKQYRQALLTLLSFALVAGLAISIKWTAVLLLLAVQLLLFFIPLFQQLSPLKKKRKYSWKIFPFRFFALLLLPFFIYFVTYLPYFFHGVNWREIVHLQATTWSSQWQNPHLHSYASSPWQWLLGIAPVWYWGMKELTSGKIWQRNIFLLENPFLSFLSIFTLGWAFFTVWKDKKYEKLKTNRSFLFTILFFFSFLFFPYFFIQRTMFFYHFLPAIIPLIILISYGVFSLADRFPKNKKNLLFFYILFACFFGFFLLFPILIGLPTPELLGNSTYFFRKF